MSQRTVLSALAAVGLLVGCGSDSSEGTTETSSEQTATEATDAAETSPPPTATPPAGSSDPTTSGPATSDPANTDAPASTDEAVTTDTNANTDASATSDPADTDPAPTSDAPANELVELSTPIPSGSFRAVAPGDAIVVGTDGDLELRPRLIGTVTDPAIPLVDNPPPGDGSGEGTGPNVIDDVAGFANGSLIYGDCCEPASGNVYALTDAGADPALIGAGFDPDLSPDGERLVTANRMMISVTSVADGSGSGLLLNQGGDDARFFDVADVQWSTDDELALLSRSGDGEFLLTAFDAGTLEETNSVVLSSAAGADPDDVSFAGFGPDDTLAVSVTGATETTIRFYEPGTLAELDATRTLPSSVSSVAFVPGDLGLTWVDGNVLYYLPSGQLEPSALANDVLAAWPLEPGLVT